MGRVKKLAPLLSAEAREALSEFPREQFVLGPGVSWPPKRGGFLDLFSGERGVAKNLAARSSTWSLCFDLAHSPNEDLLDPKVRQKLHRLIQLGCFIGAGGGPVCSSFSMAVRPPVRSASEPYGKEGISPAMQLKVQVGNDLALWFF